MIEGIVEGGRGKLRDRLGESRNETATGVGGDTAQKIEGWIAPAQIVGWC